MRGSLPPPSHAALASLPVAVLDLETTGLDVRRDRVVQIAVVLMEGARILDKPRLAQLVNPGVAIPGSSRRIHGIGDADVASAPRFADMLPQLRELLGRRVVVGHNAAFDLAVLRHEAARAGFAWPDPPALDVGMLIGALEPSIPDLGLETVARMLEVDIEGRHTAPGDAMAAAQVFSRLLPRLRGADVRTLGEAQALCARRADLQVREVQAGWHDRPGEPAHSHPGPAAPRLDSYVFTRRVSDVMHGSPVAVMPETTLRAAARSMTAHGIGSLLVGAAGSAPEGIVTERDLLRVLAQGQADPDSATVADIMSRPVASIEAQEMLYRALGRMDRLGVRHLCVVDGAGAAVGVVSQRDLLHHRARGIEAFGDPEELGDSSAMARRFSALPDLAARMLAEDVGAMQVARVVSAELRALTARAAELALSELQAEGRGRPPAPWCLLVLGSVGRGESLLAADQDNALVHSGTVADDEWFAAFGEKIARLLDEGGIALCKGGVMASNAAWRGSMDVWKDRVGRWLERAKPEDILNVDIFFDLSPAAGDAGLARVLNEYAVHHASRSAPFLGLLAESVAAKVPAVGLFGRLRTEDGGRIDLKRGGLLPLVGLARTLALRIGSSAHATPDRLQDAVTAGRLADSDAQLLVGVQSRLTELILRQQLNDLAEGRKPGTRVETGALSRQQARELARSLRRLDDTLQVLHRAIAG
ncbi:MAG TPA: DUF294 nucleotidyltransferase-like domain-containing protein [Burkholderiales bacterium]|nr:DUF294 nucleotidyltransferase-like domain-containing protein [Burkholderiales bacterium]